MAGARIHQNVLINVAHLQTHYALLILPTAALAMAGADGAFGTAYGPILALATGMFTLYGAGSLVQPWLAARLGRERLMAAFFFGTGASLIAAGTTSTPLGLALTLSAAGLFVSIYHPIGTAMLVEAAGARAGRALGVNGVFGNMGVALAPVVTALLAQASWRAAFIVPGAMAAMTGLVWLRRRTAAPEAGPAGAGAAPAVPAASALRIIIVLLSFAFISGLVFNAFTMLVPKLLEERFAAGSARLPAVGLLAFLVTGCGALTQFALGRVIDRLNLGKVYLGLALVAGPGLVLLAFVPGWLVPPVTAFVAAGIFGQILVNESITARAFTSVRRLRVYAWRYFLGFVGAAAAAPLVGFLHQMTGSVTAGTLVLGVVASGTIACALALGPNPDRGRAPAQARHNLGGM